MCDHQRRIDDDHTGDDVCIDCGLVMSRCWNSGDSGGIADDREAPRSAEMLMLREHILDLCSGSHLDTTCIVDTVVHILTELGLTPTNALKQKNLPKLAFAIWESLAREGVPRPPQFVADMCGVSPHSFLEVEKHDRVIGTYCSPSEYAETYCRLLGTSFAYGQLVVRMLKDIESGYYGHKPEVLIAAVMLFVVENFRMAERDPTFLEHFNIGFLCEHFDIKPRSVRGIRLTTSDFVRCTRLDDGGGSDGEGRMEADAGSDELDRMEEMMAKMEL